MCDGGGAPLLGSCRGTRRRCSPRFGRPRRCSSSTRTPTPAASAPRSRRRSPRRPSSDLDAPPRRITAPDTPVPFSPALEARSSPRWHDVVAGPARASRLLMATGTAVDVVMPQMGVSVSEGTITKWLKNVGDTIARDESLLEISTDKVDTEVPSPGAGVIRRSSSRRARRSRSGRCSRGSAAEAVAASEPEPRAGPPAVEGPSRTGHAPGARTGRGPAAAAHRGAPPTPAGNGHAGPAARSSRRSSPESPPSTGSTRGTVPGTGRDGRVTKKDILAFVELGRTEQRARRARRREPARAAGPAGAAALRRLQAPASAAPPRRRQRPGSAGGRRSSRRAR